MEFVKAANVSDIPEGGMKAVKVGDEDIMIANIGGRFYAVQGLCTHRQGVLGNGKLEGIIVTCPRHGSMFEVTTGKNVAGPKILGVRGRTGDLSAYEVKVEGTNVLVKI